MTAVTETRVDRIMAYWSAKRPVVWDLLDGSDPCLLMAAALERYVLSPGYGRDGHQIYVCTGTKRQSHLFGIDYSLNRHVPYIKPVGYGELASELLDQRVKPMDHVFLAGHYSWPSDALAGLLVDNSGHTLCHVLALDNPGKPNTYWRPSWEGHLNVEYSNVVTS